MKNVKATVTGSKLVIEVDLNHVVGPSSSGKTLIIATSEGNQAITGPNGQPVTIGLNVYKKP